MGGGTRDDGASAGERGLVPGVRRIAVLRANGIGDFLFTLPALDALRAAYPQAEITLLGQPWHERFLEGRPGPIDRCVVVPPSEGVRDPDERDPQDPAELDAFFARMRAEAFDLALQLHGGGRYSNPFLLRVGARCTAGLRTPDAAPLDRWVRYVYAQSEMLRFLEVVACVGAPEVSPEPRLAVTAADLAEADAALGAPGAPLAVLNVGAGDPRRRWPVAQLAALGDVLAGAGADVAVTGDGEDEVALATAVVQGMRKPARTVAGRLSLGGLAGVLARAAVVVSSDSGPLHLAAAVGAATVGIYWGPNLINAGHPTVHRHRAAASWRMTCRVCGVSCVEGRCEHDASFVGEVGVDEVADHALDLLALGTAAG